MTWAADGDGDDDPGGGEARAPICPWCGVTALPGDAGHVLEPLARRAEVVRRNSAVITQTRARVGTDVPRSSILAALEEGRPG